ncbi:MAG: hypothetical protein Q4B42_05785, partial [Oscillospiraceae bacterium]|nr:hypothetical protein [Oscillospiraceae bacterium]
MENWEAILSFIKQLNTAPKKARLDALALYDGNEALSEELQRLTRNIREVWLFFDRLADGIFNSAISSDNPFCGVCMQYESNLRHLIWQVEQIAAGDYSQHVDFMGTFSDAFNVMIKQ